MARGVGYVPVLEVLTVAQRGDGLVVQLEPDAHVLGHPLPLDASRVAISQHGQRPAVGRGNHVAAAIAVEGVDALSFHFGGSQALFVRGIPGSGETFASADDFLFVGVKIAHRPFLCLLLRELLRSSPVSHHHHHGEDNDSDEYLLHICLLLNTFVC